MSELQPGQVTIADLYRELTGLRTDISRALIRLEVIDSRNKDSDAREADHENRIRALEAFRWKLAGLALSVSFISGAAGGLIGLLLSRIR